MSKLAVYAGHGGRDFGATSSDGLREKDFTLAVSNRVTQLLRQAGYDVINNRTTDVDRSITADARRANAEGVDGVIEIHLNSNPGAPQTGTETYYSIKGGRGKELADAINRQIVELGYVDRGIKTRTNSEGKDYFGIIRLTDAPAVLVETAFINNPDDMARFNVDEMARAIVNGIEEVFPPSTGENSSEQGVVRIREGTWNVRAAPNNGAPVVGYVYGGDLHPYSRIVNGWFRLEDGFLSPAAVASVSSS